MALEFPADRNLSRRKTCELLRACDNNREHIQQWNAYRETNTDWQPAISNEDDQADLRGLTLCYVDDKGGRHGINLRFAHLDGADLRSANLSGANLRRAILREAKLGNADLSGANLGYTNLSGANLAGASLTAAILASADFSGADLENANLSGANLENVNLTGAKLRMANLSRAYLGNATLSGADLSDADLRGTNLRGSDLTNTVLHGADLRDCDVDGETKLSTSKTDGCRIDRHTLDSLEPGHRPSVADRRRMIIEDPVAMLRAAYGGFWQWVHLLAILVFVAPYAWFLASHWTVARFTLDAGDESLALWECLSRYIYSGGTAWKDGWHLEFWPFAAFVVSIAYNFLRLLMLWKTKTLELEQEVTGLPALYPLSGHRLWLYRCAKYGLWVNVLVVAYHSFHFLTQRVPVG